MEYRKLGRSGLKVSPLCLGTMMFGAWGNTDHEEGIRTIQQGARARHQLPRHRQHLFRRRVRGDRRQGDRRPAPGGGAGHQGLRRHGQRPEPAAASRAKRSSSRWRTACERLGTDYIDLYQIHRPDLTTPWEETLRALDDLVRQGKVLYLGCSTNHYSSDDVWQQKLEAWQLVESLWVSDKHGLESWVSLQPPYSLLRRSMEKDLFPATRRFGIGNIVWSPLEGGWLTGKYRRGQENPGDSPRSKRWIGNVADPKFESRLEVVEQLIPYVEAKGTTLTRFALAWALQNPDVTSVILGPRNLEQLEDCVAAADLAITAEDKAKVDELVPPGTSAL